MKLSKNEPPFLLEAPFWLMRHWFLMQLRLCMTGAQNVSCPKEDEDHASSQSSDDDDNKEKTVRWRLQQIFFAERSGVKDKIWGSVIVIWGRRRWEREVQLIDGNQVKISFFFQIF